MGGSISFHFVFLFLFVLSLLVCLFAILFFLSWFRFPTFWRSIFLFVLFCFVLFVWFLSFSFLFSRGVILFIYKPQLHEDFYCLVFFSVLVFVCLLLFCGVFLFIFIFCAIFIYFFFLLFLFILFVGFLFTFLFCFVFIFSAFEGCWFALGADSVFSSLFCFLNLGCKRLEHAVPDDVVITDIENQALDIFLHGQECIQEWHRKDLHSHIHSHLPMQSSKKQRAKPSTHKYDGFV